MLRKTLAVALSALLMATMISASASAKEEKSAKKDKQARFAEKVKSGILKLGVGKDTRVAVKLRDKSIIAELRTRFFETHENQHPNVSAKRSEGFRGVYSQRFLFIFSRKAVERCTRTRVIARRRCSLISR